MPERKWIQRNKNWIPASENSAIVRLAGEGTATETLAAGSGRYRRSKRNQAGTLVRDRGFTSAQSHTPEEIDHAPNNRTHRKSQQAYSASLALRLCRAGAIHRRPDDADPPRQASPGLREQSERGARQGSRAVREEPRGAAPRHHERAGGHPYRSAQQRGRPPQSLAVLGDHGAGGQGRRR